MGFLSAWDEYKRIDVSDLTGAPEGTWWVDVKKCLTHEEADQVLRKLMRATADGVARDGAVAMDGQRMDAAIEHQSDIVLMSIAGWNLTDKSDQILPYDNRAQVQDSLNKLPRTVYDKIAKEVMAANTETKEEVASFSSGSEGVDASGDNYTPDDSEVLV